MLKHFCYMLTSADSAIYLSTLLTLVLALQISQQASSLLQLIDLASALRKRESNKQGNILFLQRKGHCHLAILSDLTEQELVAALARKRLEVFTSKELKPVSAKSSQPPTHRCMVFLGLSAQREELKALGSTFCDVISDPAGRGSLFHQGKSNPEPFPPGVLS